MNDLAQTETSSSLVHPIESQSTEQRNYAQRLKHAFAKTMADEAIKIESTLTLNDINEHKSIVPHLIVAAREFADLLEDSSDIFHLFNGIGRFCQEQTQYAAAATFYEECRDRIEKRLGDRHPAVATSLNNLATLYRSQGRYEEAEPLYKQALAMRQELLGDRHPDFATSINDLAGLYYAQGRYEEAKPLCKQALALWQELLGDRHPSVATSLNNLALLYSSQGKYEEAESKAQAALAIHLSVLGEDHPNTRNLLLFVKGLRVQNLLQCDQQTLSAILEALAPQANLPTLDTEAMLYLLEDIATNPELLQILKQAMLQQTQVI